MNREPPVREIVVFQPERFPLYRWEDDDSLGPSSKQKDRDIRPRLPFYRNRSVKQETIKKENFSNSSAVRAAAAHGQQENSTEYASSDETPRCPSRKRSPPPGVRIGEAGSCSGTGGDTCRFARPSFLAPDPAYPCRRPPPRSKGYKECGNASIDLYKIPLKPIQVGQNGQIKEGMAQVLHDVVMGQRSKELCCEDSNNSVSVLFAIRRPGCGQCREHGMQLSEIAAKDKHNVRLTGVIKQTGVDDNALNEFYTDYFTFPLYKDEGWDLYHTMGNKKLSLWKLITKAPSLERHYKNKGIRNIPTGGDLFTQGGVLIFDRAGKLRFVYYETYGKALDMEAICWAIEQAAKSSKDDA